MSFVPFAHYFRNDWIFQHAAGKNFCRDCPEAEMFRWSSSGINLLKQGDGKLDTLIRRKLCPLSCLFSVFLNADSIKIGNGQFTLCFSIPLLCRLSEPFHAFGMIHLNAIPITITICQVTLLDRAYRTPPSSRSESK